MHAYVHTYAYMYLYAKKNETDVTIIFAHTCSALKTHRLQFSCDENYYAVTGMLKYIQMLQVLII